MPLPQPAPSVLVGPMKVLEFYAVTFQAEEVGPRVGDAPVVIAGSAVDSLGDPLAVWVEVKEETAQ